MKLPPLRTQEQYDFMKERETSSKIYSNMISKKDLDHIFQTWKDTHKERQFVAGGQHKKGTGNIRFPYDLEEFEDILKPLIDECLQSTKWRFISGRLYHVPEGRVWSTIHTDNWNYLDKQYEDGPPTNNGGKLIRWLRDGKCSVYMPWKTIIIPLDIKGSASTVLFNQHSYEVESVSWRKHKHRQKFGNGEPAWPHTDYTHYLNSLKTFNISEQHYEKYLQHVTREELTGLSVEQVYDWKVGDVVTWNSTQLHVSGYQPENTEKVGITIWTAYDETC